MMLMMIMMMTMMTLCSWQRWDVRRYRRSSTVVSTRPPVRLVRHCTALSARCLVDAATSSVVQVVASVSSQAGGLPSTTASVSVSLFTHCLAVDLYVV